MQYTIVAFFILALYSCSADTSQADNVIRDESTSTMLKGKRLQIKESTGIDLRFSFTESFPTEEGTVYHVVSHYDNMNIGFDLIIHNEGDLKLTIKGTGEDSDNFLQVLQTLYKQPADTTLKFTEAIIADCLPLGGYIDRMNKKANANTSSVIEKKLFFQGRKKDEYAEFYLAVNEQKHWIELKEADQTYRPAFIKLLTQKPKRQYKKTRKAGTRELAPGKV
jgi:hypothetical protein